MTDSTTRHYAFASEALPAVHFDVVRFHGREALGEPYEFEITLLAADPDIDYDLAIARRATFTMQRNDLDMPIHGVLSEFEQLWEVGTTTGKGTLYRAVLVPQLWNLSLSRDNRVFLDLSLPEIIEQVLTAEGFAKEDYDLRLVTTLAKMEFVCQYEETALDFLHRWIEREGITYYFEQGDDHEKLVFIDDRSAVRNATVGSDTCWVRASPHSERNAHDVLENFFPRRRRLPGKVVLRSYNYSMATIDNTAEASVADMGDAGAGQPGGGPGGSGTTFSADEYFDSPDKGGNHLAKVRAEAIKCRELTYHGTGAEMAFRAGYAFGLRQHYRAALNGKYYLIVELEHEGTQASLLAADVAETLGMGEATDGYRNHFVATDRDTQWRPERRTPWPRVDGTVSALTIGTTADSRWADMDNLGRYRVQLPFVSGNGAIMHRATHWIRKARPYVGEGGIGMHFPLNKNVEVLIAFDRGNPDRPVITAAVPNSVNKDIITADSKKSVEMKSVSGSRIAIRDDVMPRIELSTGSSAIDSHVRLGSGGLVQTASMYSHAVASTGLVANTLAGGWSANVWGGKNATVTSGFMLPMVAVAGSKVGIAAAANEIPGDDLWQATGQVLTEGAVIWAITRAMTWHIGKSLLKQVATTITSRATDMHIEAIRNLGDVTLAAAGVNPAMVGIWNYTINGTSLLANLGLRGSIMRLQQNGANAVYGSEKGNAYLLGDNVMASASNTLILSGIRKTMVMADGGSALTQWKPDEISHMTSSRSWYKLSHSPASQLFHLGVGPARLQMKSGVATSLFQARANNIALTTQRLVAPPGSDPLFPDPNVSKPGTISLIGANVAGVAGARMDVSQLGTIEAMAMKGIKYKVGPAGTTVLDMDGMGPGQVTIKAGTTNIHLSPSAVTIEGPRIDISANTQLTMKAPAGIQLDGGVMGVTIKGMKVQTV